MPRRVNPLVRMLARLDEQNRKLSAELNNARQVLAQHDLELTNLDKFVQSHERQILALSGQLAQAQRRIADLEGGGK